MRSSIRLVMGAATTFLVVVLSRYISYINYSIPLLDIIAIILVALIPGLLGASFMVSAVAAGLGSVLGVLCWLTLFYTPISGEIASLTGFLALEPNIGYIIILSATFVMAGLIGHVTSSYMPSQRVEEKTETQEMEKKIKETTPQVEKTIKEPEKIEKPPLTTSETSVKPQQLEEEIYIICKFCSEPVPEGAIFCPHCGRKVK